MKMYDKRLSKGVRLKAMGRYIFQVEGEEERGVGDESAPIHLLGCRDILHIDKGN